MIFNFKESFLKKRGTDKPRRVVALAYDPATDEAPTICAKGICSDANTGEISFQRSDSKSLIKNEDAIGDIILRIAKRDGIPIVYRQELVETLFMEPLDGEIPERLFQVVALILAELDERA